MNKAVRNAAASERTVVVLVGCHCNERELRRVEHNLSTYSC